MTVHRIDEEMARAGPPTPADWARYAPGEPRPGACR